MITFILLHLFRVQLASPATTEIFIKDHGGILIMCCCCCCCFKDAIAQWNGTEVSTEKSKIMTNSINNISADISMNSQKLEEVTS